MSTRGARQSYRVRCHALFHHSAVEEPHGPLGVARVAWIVRHHTDGGASTVQLAQQLHHRAAVRAALVTGGFLLLATRRLRTMDVP